MSLCGVCHLDSKKHSKKLWTLHQQTQVCMFCQKIGSKHSEKLWEMHKLAAECAFGNLFVHIPEHLRVALVGLVANCAETHRPSSRVTILGDR